MSTRTTKRKSHSKRPVSLFEKLYPQALFTFVIQEAPKIARDLQDRAEALVDKTPLKGHVPFLSNHGTTGGKRKKTADVLAALHKNKPWLQLKMINRKEVQMVIEKIGEKLEEALHIPTRSELNRLHDQVQEIESKLAQLRGDATQAKVPEKKPAEKQTVAHHPRNFSA